MHIIIDFIWHKYISMNIRTHPIPQCWVWAGIFAHKCWRLEQGEGKDGILPELPRWNWPLETSVKTDPDHGKPSCCPSRLEAEPRNCRPGNPGGGRTMLLLAVCARHWPSQDVSDCGRNDRIVGSKILQWHLSLCIKFWYLCHNSDTLILNKIRSWKCTVMV